MSNFASMWSVLAGVSACVAVLAVLGLLLAMIAIVRMRQDLQIVEAAERLERVDLSFVVQKYVPLGLRSQNAAEEIPLIREAIALRRPRRWRIVVVLGVLLLCAVPAAIYLLHRDRQEEALRQQRSLARQDVNALSAIQGVWGWKSDYTQSCQENPQTITVSPDHKTVLVDYAKPHYPLQHIEFTVVSTPPNGLELKPAGGVVDGSPTVTVNFLNVNTYILSNSNYPLGSTGSIERCPAATSATGTK